MRLGENLKHLITQEDDKGVIGLDESKQLVWQRMEHGDIWSRPIRDPRGEICLICNQGWKDTTSSIVDQHYWDSHERTVHESCFVRYLGLIEHGMWNRALIGAKIRFSKLESIPNGYGGGWDTPWYRVKPLGVEGITIRMGRRKRVWHIELELRGYPIDRDVFKAFENEQVTKELAGADRVYIHSYSEEDCQKYLKVFAMAMGVK